MVDDDSLACGQSQGTQGRTEPVDVHYSMHHVLADSFVSEEYCAVQDEDQVQNLATESSHVADHHKLVGVLH